MGMISKSAISDYGFGNQYTTTTSFGAQGGVSGGGFTAGESGSQAEGNNEYKKTIRPVTIKQATEATQAHPDADFKIDGAEVAQICIVGQVRNISQLTTFITYKLDDGTGEIEAKYWLERDALHAANPGGDDAMDTTGGGGGSTTAKSSATSQIVVGSYVKAWGKLATFNNRRNFTAHVIRPMKTNLNEFHCHFLEATAAHLYFSRGPLTAKGEAGGDKPGLEQGGTAAAAVAGAGAGSTAANGKVLPPMSPLARRLYQTLMETPQSNEGLHVQTLSGIMSLPVSEVYKAAEELLSNGLIFTTVDDNTWAILEF
ncbi:hypothetical protein AJ80_06264 [Polytolypa hystricis UAMH7299]|uniref:Replication protein A C-terminal domain-containing protein n=1 Tax=Polytolypa hystricis (strain UAMH7299) TaxID=1447883 RepID=A0A2B7XYD1_POLH7|nr:hypothetical protein AJ80_06264 [Polytolypa hystricis UAMH7299]